MNRGDVERLLTAASRATPYREFVIIGSLSVLGAVPSPPAAMVGSIDVTCAGRSARGCWRRWRRSRQRSRSWRSSWRLGRSRRGAGSSDRAQQPLVSAVDCFCEPVGPETRPNPDGAGPGGWAGQKQDGPAPVRRTLLPPSPGIDSWASTGAHACQRAGAKAAANPPRSVSRRNTRCFMAMAL